ncbi:MAG: hypothetical protein AAF399_11760, partial [Bacteroidota bacterium]
MIGLLSFSEGFAQEQATSGSSFRIVRIVPLEAEKLLEIELVAKEQGEIVSSESLNAVTLEVLELQNNRSSSRPLRETFIKQGAGLSGEADYIIQVDPVTGGDAKSAVYKGETRTIQVIWSKNDSPTEATLDFQIGSPSNPINFSSVEWPIVVISGLLIVAALLALLSQLLPIFN